MEMITEAKMERIYVGGLNPPHLTPSEVVKYIKKIDGIEIMSVDMNDNKTFVHFDACSLKEGETAYEIVAKTYNKRKWKGCRLVVQVAKIPFLKRLEHERQEKIDREAELNNTTTSSSALPRHLRIRQKAGREAHKVDTKPCKTNDWDKFENIWTQLKKRRDRKSYTGKDVKTKAFYNRGVHLIFDEDNKNKTTEKSLRDEGKDRKRIEKPDSSASFDSEDSEDESPKDNITNKPKPGYEWSSEENTSDDNSDHEDDESLRAKKKSRLTKINNPTTDGNNSNENSLSGDLLETSDKNSSNRKEISKDNSKSKNDTVKGKEKDGSSDQNINTTNEKRSLYEWSSDEDTSSEEEKVDDSSSKSDDITVVSKSDSSIKSAASNEDPSSSDLEKDVDKNMEILSKMFPDFKPSTPKEVKSEDEKTNKSSVWNIDNMTRYDPTKESAKLYEMSNEDQNKSDDEPDGIKDEDSSTVDGDNKQDSSDSDSKDQTDHSVTDTGVYDESKLEEVFRKARDSGEGGGFQVSSTFGEQPDELKKQETNNEEENNKSSFSFGFDLGPVLSNEKKIDNTENQDNALDFNNSLVTKGDDIKEDYVSDEEPIVEKITKITPSKRKRSKGLIPPNDMLEQYCRRFFHLNEGLIIAGNPERFRNDGVVKNEWERERKALTSDWKRKKKWALQSRERKNKFRK